MAYWLGIMGPVKLDTRLQCQEVFVEEEAVKVGRDQAMQVWKVMGLKRSQFEV